MDVGFFDLKGRARGGGGKGPRGLGGKPGASGVRAAGAGRLVSMSLSESRTRRGRRGLRLAFSLGGLKRGRRGRGWRVDRE